MQERQKQLSENLSQGNEKIKSQRGSAVDVYVNNRVKWPHEFAHIEIKVKKVKRSHKMLVKCCLVFISTNNICLQKNYHEIIGVLYRHICLACFSVMA